MQPPELAVALKEELEAALAGADGGTAPFPVVSVEAPEEIRADTCFRITIRPAEGPAVPVELPTNLAVAYLADEEAAVDEWRLWLHELIERLPR